MQSHGWISLESTDVIKAWELSADHTRQVYSAAA